MVFGMMGGYEESYMDQLQSLAKRGNTVAQYVLENTDRIVYWLHPFGDKMILRGVGLIRDKEKSPDERYNIRWFEFHNNRS